MTSEKKGIDACRRTSQFLTWLLTILLVAVFAGCGPSWTFHSASKGEHPARQRSAKLWSDGTMPPSCFYIGKLSGDVLVDSRDGLAMAVSARSIERAEVAARASRRGADIFTVAGGAEYQRSRINHQEGVKYTDVRRRTDFALYRCDEHVQ